MVDIGIALENARRSTKTNASIVASGHARRRLRISGVVSSTSPSRRNVITRMLGDGGRSMRVIVALS